MGRDEGRKDSILFFFFFFFLLGWCRGREGVSRRKQASMSAARKEAFYIRYRRVSVAQGFFLMV